VEAVHALDIGAAVVGHAQAVPHVDALDHQDAVLLLDLADRLDVVLLRIDFDLTRFQRAGEGAGQSAAGGGDNVVECGGMRRILLGLDAVVLGHLGVDAERDGLRLGRKVREPLWAAEALDPHA
jgi:hypothetical protein